MQYDIMYGGNKVGTASTQKSGLYAEIVCKCQRLWEIPVKIGVQSGNKKLLLGTCIPEKNELSLHKKVSLRSLGDGELHFFLANLPEDNRKIVRSDEDFPMLTQIMNGRFYKEGDAAYLVFTDSTVQDPQGSDQNP